MTVKLAAASAAGAGRMQHVSNSDSWWPPNTTSHTRRGVSITPVHCYMEGSRSEVRHGCTYGEIARVVWGQGEQPPSVHWHHALGRRASKDHSASPSHSYAPLKERVFTGGGRGRSEGFLSLSRLQTTALANR